MSDERQLRLYGGQDPRRGMISDVASTIHTALASALADVRYALRGLRRSPAFTLTAVTTMALTIGAVASVMSLADALLFRILDVEHAEEVVVVSATRRQGTVMGYVSFPDYEHLRDRTRSMADLAAHYSTAPLWVSLQSSPEEINGAAVSANFFQLLRLQPALGRFFTEDEDRVPDRDKVAVLSHELWRTSFESSPDVLGKTIRINQAPFTVIGVAPEGFRGLSESANHLYVPTMMLRVAYRWCDALSDGCTTLRMIGRLAPGRSLQDGAAEMRALMPPRWKHAREGENDGIAVFRPRGASLGPNPQEARALRLLALVVGVLLLAACANLAGLLLARGRARGRELSLRTALGASRTRLVRQLMTESTILALVGGGAGALFSVALTRLVGASFYSVDVEGYARHLDLRLDATVLVGVVGASLLAAVLFGLVPAIRATDLGAAVSRRHDGPTVRPRGRLRGGLVASQTVAAVALVLMAVLLASGARDAASGVKVDPAQVVLLRTRPRLVDYPPERAQRFQRDVVRQLEALPEVESVSLVGTGGVLTGGSARISRPKSLDSVDARYMEVGSRYLETLGTPLLAGREFDDGDELDSPAVAIVNATLARRWWPEGDAVGASLLVRGRPHRVVGIAADIGLESHAQTPRPTVYASFWQNPQAIDARYCIRVRDSSTTVLPRVVREVGRVDSNVPVTETVTLGFQMAEGMLRPVRLAFAVLGYAAVLSVVLSALGLYGSLAYAVSRRTKEIGIRMALGALPGQVSAFVVREGLTTLVLGAAGGIAAGWVGSRLTGHLLFGTATADPLVYLAAAGLVIVVGLVACWIPARRAARVPPAVALHHE